MEEGVPPAGEVNDEEPPLPLVLRPSPGRPTATYVVQIPKDQIYRVPPPENALIVQQYLNPPVKKRRCSGLLWVLIILLILALVIGITLGALYFFLKPTSPEFSIARVRVKDQNSTSPTYEISLQAKNRNEMLGVCEGSGDASLSFKQKNIASGGFPASCQGNKGSSDLELVLVGEKGLKDSKSANGPVSLDLMVKASMQGKLWALNTKSSDMEVACNFRVSTLGTGTKVLSQECRTKV